MWSADEAAKRLNTTARIVRYRERLGLLRPGREARRHRRFTEEDLAALRLAEGIERSYGVAPREVAFALAALTSPRLAAELKALAETTGRLVASNAVLNFDQEKALALLTTRSTPQRRTPSQHNR